jgi:hypothetical protein
MLAGGPLYVQPLAHGTAQLGHRIMQPAALLDGALFQHFGG